MQVFEEVRDKVAVDIFLEQVGVILNNEITDLLVSRVL